MKKEGRKKEKGLQPANLLKNVSLYIPDIVYSEITKRKNALVDGITKDCSILIADITGFTSLSERLSRIGKEGAEEITEIVNGYFSNLLDIIFKYKGDLFHFSGDALSVFYYAETGKKNDSEMRALLSAWEMKRKLVKFGHIETSQGTFPIKVHITLHTGKVKFIQAGMKDAGLFVFACGKTTNEIAALEAKGKSGEVVMSDIFYRFVKKNVKVDKKTGCYLLGDVKVSLEIKKSRKKRILSKKRDSLLKKIEAVKPFVNPVLFGKISGKKSLDVWSEHRKVTTMFINFEGFDFDKDRSAVTNLQRYFSELETIVERYDGSIDKVDFASIGCNVMVLFGVPFAHEDDEERAVLCAFDLLAGVWSQALKIKMRIGINSGYVFAGNVGCQQRREYTVMGDEVNLAARLLSKAKESDIIVSHSVRNKVKNSFQLTSKKEVKIKGKKKPVKIFRVTHRKEKSSPKDTLTGGESRTLVGRDREMKRLQRMIKKVEKGKGYILRISGEAGVGKSRITREFIDLWSKKKFKYAAGNCQFYGKPISYLPWIELLASYVGIDENDKDEKNRKKIEGFLRKVNPSLVEWSPVIGEFLGVNIEETKLTSSIDAKLRKQRLFDIILEVLSFSKKPLLLILEDFHWADSASCELLNYVGRNIANIPIFLLIVTRPVKEEPGFKKYENYREIILEELNQEEIRALVASLLGTSNIEVKFLAFIRKETQGNPFYVEELVKSLMERSFLRRVLGKWIFPEDISELQVPDTIQGIIMSRIDRLPTTVKQALVTASVIGREFDYSTLERIFTEDRKRLKGYLSSLERLDLLQYRRMEKEHKYIFKHILTQEVAYDSLSYKKKRDLHLSVANFIEKKKSRDIEEVLGILTHHFYKGRDWEKAFYYSIEAGDKAKKGYANIEALNYYDRALEILDKMKKNGLLEKIWKRIKSELRA